MKKFIFSIILIISSFMIFNQNAKAFEFTVGVTKYRDVVFGGKYQYAIPFPQANSSVEVKFDNLNHTIYCDTTYCGLNYYYTTTYLSNSSSTDTIQFYANSVGLDANGYPPCSVSGGSISCIVPNGLNIRGVSLYFSRTQGNVTTVIDSMLAGTYTVFNINDNSASSITSAINTQSQQQHQDSQAINNSINNDNVDSASSSADTWNSKNASNGVITQLLTLPITLLNAIVNGIQTSCSSFNLGNLFGTDIVFPCISVSNLIGSTLFTTIDLLISGFMIYNISKKLIKIFNDFTNLKSNQIDEIYGGGNN